MSTDDSTKIPIPDDLKALFVQIIERLERLEARAYHAQPDLPSMLKQVLDVALEPIHAGIQKLETEVHELKTRVEKLEQRQEQVEIRLGNVETELKQVKVELGDMDRSIMRVQGDVVRRLERFDDRIMEFENRQLVSK